MLGVGFQVSLVQVVILGHRRLSWVSAGLFGVLT